MKLSKTLICALVFATFAFSADSTKVDNSDSSAILQLKALGQSIMAVADSGSLIMVDFHFTNGQNTTLFGFILMKSEITNQYILMFDSKHMTIMERRNIAGITFKTISLKDLRDKVKRIEESEKMNHSL